MAKQIMKRFGFILLIISIFCFFLTNNLFSQHTNIYQQDLIELLEIIKKTHPSDDSIKQKIINSSEQYLNRLEHCENIDVFKVEAQEFIAQLDDGHSKVYCYDSFSRKGYYPIHFSFINEKLYIAGYTMDIPTIDYIGEEVKSINGIKISELIIKAERLISSDTKSNMLFLLQYNLNKPSFLEYLDIDADTLLKLELENSDTISFKRDWEHNKFYMQDSDVKYEIDTLNIVYYKKAENSLTGWSDKLFEYHLIKERNVCYFKFSECFDLQFLKANPNFVEFGPLWLWKMSWYFRGGNFSKFLKKMFDDIEKNDINNLIIDVRYNRGGTSILNYQLLDYFIDMDTLLDYQTKIKISVMFKNNFPKHFDDLAKTYNLHTVDTIIDIKNFYKNTSYTSEIQQYLREKDSPYYQEEPTNKFKGNIYIMVGKRTFSSAAMLAVLLADNKIAKVVGNKIGTRPTHYGELLNFKLSNTKTKGIISCKLFIRPDSTKGLCPLKIDFPVYNSVIDEFDGKDKEFEYLLNMIEPN